MKNEDILAYFGECLLQKSVKSKLILETKIISFSNLYGMLAATLITLLPLSTYGSNVTDAIQMFNSNSSFKSMSKFSSPSNGDSQSWPIFNHAKIIMYIIH